MPKEQRKGAVSCLAVSCCLEQFNGLVLGFHGAQNVNKACCDLNCNNFSVSNSSFVVSKNDYGSLVIIVSSEMILSVNSLI